MLLWKCRCHGKTRVKNYKNAKTRCVFKLCFIYLDRYTDKQEYQGVNSIFSHLLLSYNNNHLSSQQQQKLSCKNFVSAGDRKLIKTQQKYKC